MGGDLEVFCLQTDPKKEKMKLLYNFALFGSLAYATTTIDGSTSELAASKTEPESSVAVKDASEIKKNESSAKVPITKVQKKHHHKKGSKGGHSGSKKRRNHNRKKKGAHK